MPANLDPLLLMLIGSGMSEKRVRELILGVRETEADEVIREYRSLKKAVQKAPRRSKPVRRSIEEEVDIALLKLRSVGQYSESEIVQYLADAAGQDLVDAMGISKGGLRPWLVSFAKDVGVDKMEKAVSALRNQLAHQPRTGWTIKDVR